MAIPRQTWCWRRSWGLYSWIYLLIVLIPISLYLFKPPQRFNCWINTIVSHLFYNIPWVSFPFWSHLRLSFLIGKFKSLLILKTFVYTITELSISASPGSPCPLLQLTISILRLCTRSALSVSFQAPRAMLHVCRIKPYKLSVAFFFRRKRESQFVIKIPAWLFQE